MKENARINFKKNVVEALHLESNFNLSLFYLLISFESLHILLLIKNFQLCETLMF